MHWQSTLNQQVDGPIDGDADRTRFLVDPAVAIKCVLFLHPDPVQLPALVFLQPRTREYGLRIAGSHVPGIFWNILNQGTHCGLRGSFMAIKKRIDAFQHEESNHCRHGQSQKKIQELLAAKSK